MKTLIAGLLGSLAVFAPFAVNAAAWPDAQRLAQTAQWLSLLHWEARQSRIDAPSFFLHPQGYRDAQAELEASHAALLRDEKTRCRFPARLRFLARHDARLAALPVAECAEYRRWRARLNPQSATLVFASAYLGNPSSLFGHTFLRLDAGGNPLLSWAVNFAAQTGDSKGLAFAWKGMMGGYPGRFGLAPYYDKVTEYARLEQRSLWEYRLALNPSDLDFLLAHLWEMREVWFDYFFFQENCSFQLLALLQVLRPQLPLTQGFALFAAPVDTVRRLQAYGLIESVQVRPAQQARLRQQMAGLPHAQQVWLQQRAAQPDHAWDADRVPGLPQQQARLLDTLAEWAQLQQLRGPQAVSWAQLELRALEQRSALAWRSNWPPMPAAQRPDQAHLSQRLVLGGQVQSSRKAAVDLGWRPVLHDALDGGRGLPAGSEIAVLDTRLRWRDEAWRLQALELFDVRALPLRDAWFQPWSWQLGVGYARDPWSDAGYWQGRAAIGGSWALPAGFAGQTSLLARGSLLLGKGGQRALESRLEWTLQGHWQADWPWQLQLHWLRRDGLIAEDSRRQAALRLGQQWQINPAWALRLQAMHRLSQEQNQASLQLAHYF